MPTPTTPALSASFRRQGAMIMCVFALPWAATGIGALGEGAAYWSALTASVLITIALAVYSVRFTPRENRDRTIPANWQRRYIIAILGELVLIAAAVVLLNLIDAPDLIPAVVAVIVGVHFLPLAGAFDQPQYRLTAAGLCVAGLAGAVLFFTADAALCGVVAGIGTALTLWLTSLSVTRAG